MTDTQSLPRLGKCPPKLDDRTLQLERYVDLAALPKPPSHLAPPPVPTWPMYGNDRYGDCVEADMGHQIEAWTAAAGAERSVTDGDVLAAYAAIAGFDPANPASDQGTYWLDALNWWRDTGLAGHRIEGFVSITPSATNIRLGAWLFGGVQLGIALPKSAQGQSRWVVRRGPGSAAGSWGGHAVPALAYDASAVTVVTWGGLLRTSWAFLARYVDEAYVALSSDWVDRVTQRSPRGIDVDTLRADLAQFA